MSATIGLLGTWVIGLARLLHLIVAATLAFAFGVWMYFVHLGYQKLGHLPVYGDEEVISFDGPDRYIFIATFMTAFYGGFALLTLIAVRTLLKDRITRSQWLALSVLTVMAALVIWSPQTNWMLD